MNRMGGVLMVVSLLLVGCSKGGSNAKPTAEAQTLFKSRCAVCHGETGGGDGPGAASLNPKPRNFGDGGWQAGVTDAQIKETILKGGGATGKSPLMPAAPDLESNPAMLEGLVGVVRSLKK